MKRIIGSVLILLLCHSSNLHSTTQCGQKFALLGRVKGSTPVFMIIQDLSGECRSSTLIEIALTGDGVTYIPIEFAEKGSWQWFEEGMDSLRTEPFKQIEKTDSIWQMPNAGWKIKNPPEDEKLIEEFNKGMYPAAAIWNREQQDAGVQRPVFDGINTELIYYLPSGLYMDYAIDKVYLFEKSGYIIIFTNQRRKADGMDTMHGFLMFKIL